MAKLQIDYTKVIEALLGGKAVPEEKEEAVGTVFKTVDAANVIGGLLKNVDLGALLALLLPLLGQLINKPKETKPSEPTKPKPEPSTPAPKPTEPAPTPAKRRISSIRAKYFWITSDGKLLDKATFDQVLSRETPLREGDRVCVDATPFDQNGVEIKPGPDLEAIAWYPDGTPRIRWYGNDGGVTRITGGEHNSGCTPKIKVERDILDDNQEAETGRTYGVYESQDGDEVVTNILDSLRIKGEKNR